MRQSTVFFDSFLDGFTMAGFLSRLRQPGEATQMFATAPVANRPDWQALTFEPAPSSSDGVEVAGNLRAVPEKALHVMIDLLKREDEDRKASGEVAGKAGYGASR